MRPPIGAEVPWMDADSFADGASIPLLAVVVAHEPDVVTARQRARQIAEMVGFEEQDQVRIATAVSEIARNAFRYAGGGRIEFLLHGTVPPQLLTVVVSDRGPGFRALDDVLDGRFRSTTGMGRGIVGTRRLMDQFSIHARPGGGSVVTMGKLLPTRARLVDRQQVARIVALLAAQRPPAPLEEVAYQNRELLRALEELRKRQDDLERLNAELEDTNRGVVALYAELDEKADHLQRADQMKSRFLSNMTHEFRTPLNSILALTRLLLDRRDGALSAEQEVQVSLVRKAAQDLSELVNDLLDLAKVEAGKTVVHPTEFDPAKMFGALRGMLRPLLVSDAVTLSFEEPEGVPLMWTDEAKVSQILRNFISNALKFTERGEVRVTASYDPDTAMVTFRVSDTGIGIAPEDQDRIFQEFSQVEHPVQRRVRGTGLGLPLSRKLAHLLGGRLGVVSEPGNGSTFFAIIPAKFVDDSEPAAEEPAALPEPDSGRVPVLVVEDAAEDLLVYDHAFSRSAYQPVFARTVREARQALRQLWAKPAAVVLDVLLRDEDTWRFLSELKTSDETSSIPIVVVSSVDDTRKGLALGADVYAVKPIDGAWLIATLKRLVEGQSTGTVLIIDDDRAARYVMRRHLEDDGWVVVEAENGAAGLRMAGELAPSAIVLDLVMPELGGQDVLARLRRDPITRDVPVVVSTSKALADAEVTALATQSVALLSKDLLSLQDASRHLAAALREAGLRDRRRRE
jgi:signal transduction histidine kinase/DNA-binding response OmpR family regulator